jgi:hypothetical protein
MLHNFKQKFVNASGPSKLCAETLNGWSESASIFCLQKSPNIVLGDKMWVHGYDIEPKQQSHCTGRVLLTFSSPSPLNQRGIVHYEVTHEAQKINQDFYQICLWNLL